MYSHPKTFWLPNFCRTSLTLFTEGEGRRIIPAWFPWLDVVIVSKSPSLMLRMGCGLWVGGRWRAREAVIVSVCDLSSSPQHRGPGPQTPPLSPRGFRFFLQNVLKPQPVRQRSCPVTVEVYIIELRAGNNQHQISQIIMAGCVGCGGRLGPFCYV